MNAASNRPALNMTIFVSVMFHVVVIYYLATAWKIIPPLIPTPPEDRSVPTVYLPPPPPPEQKVGEIQRVRPHQTERIIESPVPPIPLPPVTASDAPGNTMIVDAPIPESPIVRQLPTYPPRLQDDGIEGDVRLSVTILPDGSVTDIRVLNSRGGSLAQRGAFERSAVAAVQRWRYQPSNVIRRNVIIDVTYRLQ